ncbi:MAG: class I SAM-dependent methyltransferase [Verrucomicrobiota bacterium]
MKTETTAANYRYWQEQGQGWPTEYDRRKRGSVLYHLQEVLLADYMNHSSPARVLEFGCGFGRHLKYLSQIPGIDVHGYDQSPTMVSGFAAWAEPEWVKSHVTVGEPVGKLPYADGAFDIVYTAEVLVHVRPQDLPVVLRELMRVARWQVFHLETARDCPLIASDHDGCWFHDLVQAYRTLEVECQLLDGGYLAHVPHRIILDRSRPVYSGSSVIASLLKRAEVDLQPTLNEVQENRLRIQEAAELRQQLRAVLSQLT